MHWRMIKKRISRKNIPGKVRLQNHLPHIWFDEISNDKHDIYLYGKLSTKLLAQAADKNANLCLIKLGGCFFLKYGFKSYFPKKF